MAQFEIVTPDGRHFQIEAADINAAQDAVRTMTGGDQPPKPDIPDPAAYTPPPGAAPVDMSRPPPSTLDYRQRLVDQGQLAPPAPPPPMIGGHVVEPQPGFATPRPDIAAAAAQREAGFGPANDDLGDLGYAPAAEPVDQRSPTDRAFELGLQGVGAGVADLAGAPVDLGNALLNLIYSGVNKVTGAEIPLVQQPFGGSQMIRDIATPIAEGVGLDVLNEEEMTGQEHLGYNIARGGTAAALGAGWLARAAPAAGAISQGPRWLEPLTRAYTADAGRAFTGDVAAGAGAGTGNYLYNENASQAFKDSSWGPIAAIVANMGGGIAGQSLLSAAETGGRVALRNTDNALRGPYDTSIANNAAGVPFRRADVTAAASRVQNAAVNPFEAEANLRSTRNAIADLSTTAPSVSSTPTSGLMSNDVGLINMENQARARNNVPFIVRDNAVRDAATSQVDRIAPSTAVGRQFTDTAAALDADRVAGAQFLRDEAQQQVRAAEAAGQADAVPVNMPFPREARADAALGIDANVVDQTMRPMQDASAQAYDRARSLGVNEQVDLSPVRDALDTVQASISQLIDPATGLPSDLAERITAAIDDTGHISVADIIDVWPSLSRMEDRARTAGNVTLRENITTLREGMSRAIEMAAADGMPGAQAAMDAQQNFAETLGTTFGRNAPVAQQLRRDFNQNQAGRSETPPSATAGQFLRRGQPEKAVELQNIIARSTDPAQGQEAVHQYLMSDLAASGAIDARTGQLRPDTLRRWRDEWGASLDISPETRAAVDDLIARADNGELVRADAMEGLDVAARTLGEAETNKGAFRFVLDRDPANAVRDIFGAGDAERVVAEIFERIGTNNAAHEGFKAAVRDYLLEQATTSARFTTSSSRNPLSFPRLDDLFKRSEHILSTIFSPEEMNALRAAHKMFEPLTRRAQQGTTGSGTAERTLAEEVVRTAELGIRTYYGALQGGAIMKKVKLWMDQLPSNRDAVAELVHRFYFDPEFAMTLLRTPVRNASGPRYNARLNRLLGLTAGSREAQDETVTP